MNSKEGPVCVWQVLEIFTIPPCFPLCLMILASILIYFFLLIILFFTTSLLIFFKLLDLYTQISRKRAVASATICTSENIMCSSGVLSLKKKFVLRLFYMYVCMCIYIYVKWHKSIATFKPTFLTNVLEMKQTSFWKSFTCLIGVQ